MKNRFLAITLIIALSFTLMACGHEHQFSEATCTTPATCMECGETEGEPLGHDFSEATCNAPMTCTLCGVTDGNKLEHQWIEATTEAPKTCELCGLTDGEPLPSSNIHVDSTGSDVQLAEDEYQGTRPEDDVVTSNSEYSAETQTAIDNATRLYEKGLVTKEEYDELIADCLKAAEYLKEDNGVSTNTNTGGYTISPELEAMRTDNKGDVGDNRTNIVYGQGDYSGLEGIYIR